MTCKFIPVMLVVAVFSFGCGSCAKPAKKTNNNRVTGCNHCGENTCDKETTQDTIPEKKKILSCKLTSTRLQKRKATIIDQLRRNRLEKQELKNGFAFRFVASDEMIDTLAVFVKSERQCCDFFHFAIRVQNNNVVWLDITGPEGAKEFIQIELEM